MKSQRKNKALFALLPGPTATIVKKKKKVWYGLGVTNPMILKLENIMLN